MSIIRADSIKNRAGDGAPDFPNGITITGVVTATTLNSVSNNIDVDDFIEVGNNIQLGNAGVITATSGNFTGNVSIGGTLTYEDVTNIDSVGLITARDGVFIPDNKELKIGNTAGSPDLKIYHIADGNNIIENTNASAQLRFLSDNYVFANKDSNEAYAKFFHDGAVELYYNNSKKLNTEAGGVLITGVCSATSYTGDGSALTGITQTTINNNADNRIITGSGTANTLNAETNVVIDSSGRLLLGHSSSRQIGGHTALYQQEGTSFSNATLSITANSADTNGSYLILGNQRSGSTGGNTIVQSGDEVGTIRFAASDGTDMNTPAAQIRCVVDGTPGSNDMPGRLVFSTTADGSAAPSERMKIDSAGNVTVTNGNLVIGTNNKGIDFSATANATVMNEGFSTTAPTMDNELLKSYERGTWTGNIRGYDHAGGAGWGTVATTAGTNQATGRYIRIGNVVHCWIKFSGITWDTSWTYPSIVGIPFGHNHYDGAGGFCIAQDTNMFTDSTGTCMGNVMGSQGYTVGQRPNGQTNLTFDTSNGNRHMFASMTFYTSTGG